MGPDVHSFHIPVMGTGFTLDTPLKVARFGIDSVVSICDDRLVEDFRRHYCAEAAIPCEPIGDRDPDHRSRRIRAFLNLLQVRVDEQVRWMKSQTFAPDTELTKYFEMADDTSKAKALYRRMRAETEPAQKRALQGQLLEWVRPGRIDVNILTKADRDPAMGEEHSNREDSDACTALKGFAESHLRSSVVLSAGLNLFLYGYLARFRDFFMDADGRSNKEVILKVSDFRSAMVQAKIFAKKGIWVSEFRVESGLNCGGHAFPTTGQLLGPILEEFCQKKEELITELFEICSKELREKGRPCPSSPPEVRLTAQGGVGTHQEHDFLRRRFGLRSVGWGTPFLLVPEATTVDDATLRRLQNASPRDIVLSKASPLGVPFYLLRNSASERARIRRAAAGKPGSPCVNKYLALNTEYGEKLCTASFAYQNRKIKDLRAMDLPEEELDSKMRDVLAKACICRDLGDGLRLKYGIEDKLKERTPAICPGPNLPFFKKVSTLHQMLDHIYGRDFIAGPQLRLHCLVNELKLYIKYLRDRVRIPSSDAKEISYCRDFKANLTEGILYYRSLAGQLLEETDAARGRFERALGKMERALTKTTV